MAKRLKKDCGLKEDEKLWEIGRGFIVRDLPKTEAELRKYPAFEFEMGGERVTRSEWLHIAAPLVAVIGILMASHRLRIRWAKTLVASRRNCDVCPDRRLCVDLRRTEPDSSRGHVARDYQWHSVWWRFCLVFLF